MSLTKEKFVEVWPKNQTYWFIWDRPDVPKTWSWSNITDKPETFPPSTHLHDWEDITNKPETFPSSNTAPSIYALNGWYFNALKDTDLEPLMDTDGFALYEPWDVFDNPPVPTRYDCDTLADLLALDGWMWDRAVTRNYATGDGIRAEWRQVGDPTLADNGTNLRATDDGYGFAERVALL